MFNSYVKSILDGRKYEADKGSTGNESNSSNVEQNEADDKSVDKNDDSKKDEPEKPAKKERTFTRGEVAKIVKEETQKALDESEKLKNMNEDEKAEYRIQQLEKELQDERQKNTFNAMSKEASKMLSDASITADDEILDFVVKDTAEATKEAVDKFISLVDKSAEAKTKEALSGKPPKINLTPGKQMTKQEIMEIKDPVARQKAIKENIHLFR